MEKVIYSNNGGLGLILNCDDKPDDFINPVPVKILGCDLIPESFSDLWGQFSKPVKYCGLLKNQDPECMVFLYGTNSNLFESKTYYSCFFLISETRIANKYKEGTVRDFNWVNGKWK